MAAPSEGAAEGVHLICPITHEIMSDPVIAADGHTYEREGIERWFETHETSPVTREALESRRLLPNRAMKSMIEQWREEQKGVVPQQRRLKNLLADLQWCTTSAAVAGQMHELSEFMAQALVPIPARRLMRLRNSFEGDEELWSDAVGVALDAVEAQSQTVTNILLCKLHTATLLHDSSIKARARAVTMVPATENELKKALRIKDAIMRKSRVDKLHDKLEEALEARARFHQLEEEFKEEVQNLKLALGDTANDTETGKVSPASKKRKRRAGKSGNKAAKQPKPDMGVVYVQGYELQQACNFKREDAHRGQVSSAETA